MINDVSSTDKLPKEKKEIKGLKATQFCLDPDSKNPVFKNYEKMGGNDS